MVKADHIAFKRVVWHEKFVNTSSDHISAFYINCAPRVLHGMSVFPRRTLKNGSCTPKIFGPKYMDAAWTTWPTDLAPGGTGNTSSKSKIVPPSS